MTFDEAVADVVTDDKVRGPRAIKDEERRIHLHLLPCFGNRRMVAVTAGVIRAYAAHRQEQHASNAAINRSGSRAWYAG